MPRKSLGPRLYYDSLRETWIIRDGTKFIRTGAGGWKKAEQRFTKYLRDERIERRPPPKPIPGFVYFISVDSQDFPIKIGFTERRNTLRLRGIQTGCPYPLYVMAMFPGTYKDERGLHRQFGNDRLCGEWFRRHPDLMNLIEKHRIKEAA